MAAFLFIVGAVLGAWLAGIHEVMLGIGAGAIVGIMWARNIRLENRLKTLEQRLAEASFDDASRSLAAARSPAPARRAAAAPVSADSSDAVDPVSDSGDAPPIASASAPETEIGAGGRPASAQPGAAEGSARPSRETIRFPGSDLLASVWTAARRWITTGNVPVKVGVIVLFFGVAFLLKYAVERSLLVIPIELRLLAVAGVAVALLAVGWRLRGSHRVYALSLQGGGIGVLYLTIFAAFRLYGVVPSLLAFLLLVVLTGAAGVLAVRQDARALAVLGIVGGFLAPVLVSTGAGSHVALFSYYLLLNAAILGISWFRAWRELNVIGFAFTFGIGTLWGINNYRPELYATTQPFLVLYFLFYQAIAILFAHRQPLKLRGLVDGTILFGTPVISFALQERLVELFEYGLAISAAVTGVFYVVVAGWLYRRHRETLRLLVESYVALAVAFATIAIPLALDARWTAAAWALEGAALCWVGVRQHGLLAKAAGVALLFASGASFIEAGWADGRGLPVLNGNVLGGVLIALSSLFAAYRLYRDDAPHPFQHIASHLLLAWGMTYWLGTGWAEIFDRINSHELSTAVLYLLVSFVALGVTARKLAWLPARRATFMALPLMYLFGLACVVDEGHWFVGIGWVAWPAAALAHAWLMKLHDNDLPRLESLWHVAGALLFAAGVAVEAHWRLGDWALNSTWQDSAALAVIGLAAWKLVLLRDRFAWPLQRYWNAYLAAGGLQLAILLLLLTVMSLERSGNPAPLPYIPLFNPFDILMLASLLLAMRYLRVARDTSDVLLASQQRFGIPVWAALAFVLTTAAVVRAVHHLAGVPWTDALFGSVSVQAALSIYWGILGFAGMVIGARRGMRTVWLLGTAMMALVVGKLFLVDLGNTGTVARIVSFIGVGGLLLVVGYFAPAPPRDADTREASEQT